jgi:putative polymerase
VLKPNVVSPLLVASVCYLAVLSFLNARGITASASEAGGVEVVLYLLCFALQARRVPLLTLVMAAWIASWLVFSWLMRQSPDIKGLRDLMIPILFIGLGRQVANVQYAERSLAWIVGILIALGLFEALFTNAYSQLFNTFSFYVNLGGIREGSAAFEGQMLTLNGYRPEGIGRTILPSLLGAHRTSSALMEPVSLGNMGVILLAWGLSKSWEEIQRKPFIMLSAALLITLADSRLGLVMGGTLLGFRMLPLPMLRRAAPFFPFLIFACVVGAALLFSGTDDTLAGRVSRSGSALLRFDWALILGLSGPLPNFGDMGFAYILSRFGAPLCLSLILAIFMVPMADARGERFRVFVVLYIFANFAISGTSVFALKTAGIMWFLFGVLSTSPHGARI